MNVLIIAPFFVELPGVIQEVQEVANTLGAKIAQGVITDDKITNVVRRFGPFDLTIYAGHLGEEGFPRGDGGYLPVERFTMMLDTKHLFINACDGDSLVDTIRSRTQSHVITATGEIDDSAALAAMRTFADGVADTGDIEIAFGKLRETRQYQFFENRAAVRDVNRSMDDENLRATPQIERRVDRLESITAALQKTVDDLSLIVRGSSEIGFTGLKKTVDDMRSKIDEMHLSLSEIRKEIHGSQAGEIPEVLSKNAVLITVIAFALLFISVLLQSGLLPWT